jgi:hypothetical protein
MGDSLPLIEARKNLEESLEELDAVHREFVILMGVLHERKSS